MNEKDINILWKHYIQTRDVEMRQTIITHYAQLVKLVAGRLSIYLNQYVDLDDLIGYGVLGLIDAIDKFDLSKNVKFETYASLRIRGSILDAIRKQDWVPRSLRKKQKDLERTQTALEIELGRIPTDEEVATYLKLDLEDYYHLLGETNIVSLISIDEYPTQIDSIKEGKNSAPDDYIEEKEVQQALQEAIEQLPDRERKVITMYYFEELTLKEISHVLEVSESRVSQLHTKGVSRLKNLLKKYHIELPL